MSELLSNFIRAPKDPGCCPGASQVPGEVGFPGPAEASGNIVLTFCRRNRGFRVREGSGELRSRDVRFPAEVSVQGEQAGRCRVGPRARRPRVPLPLGVTRSSQLRSLPQGHVAASISAGSSRCPHPATPPPLHRAASAGLPPAPAPGALPHKGPCREGRRLAGPQGKVPQRTRCGGFRTL